MDSRQLQCFIAAAKEKSIIKAADYLPLTPSAIAKKIIALEEELGVALFERLARGVRLTPAGEVWFEHAHQLLDEIALASNEVRRASQGILFRRLDIGVPDHKWIYTTAIKKVFEKFSRNNPDIDIITHQIYSRQQQIEALRQGIIHVAFSASFQQAPDLVVEKIAQEDTCLVASIDHPLANYSAVHLEKLRDQPIIGFKEKVLQDSYEIAFKIYNINPKIAYNSSEVFAHLGLCACNQGVALLAAGIQRTKFPAVKFIPILSNHPLTVRYDCAYLKNQSSPLLQEFIKSLRSYHIETAFYL